MAEDEKQFNISPKIEELQSKLDKDPDSKIFLPLAEEYRKSGMLEEAIAICQDGLKKHPNYVSARVVLGRAYMELKRTIEAQAEFEEVISKIPDNLMANKHLGDIYFMQGNLKSALERYQAVLRLDPHNEEVVSKVKKLSEQLDQRPPISVPPEEVPGEPQTSSKDEQTEEPTEEPAEEREEEHAQMVIDLTEEEGSLPTPKERPEEPQPQIDQPTPPLHEESSPPPAEESPAPPPEPELPVIEEERDEMVTETMAELFAKQGLLDKAIKVYERLLESNPDNMELKFRYEQLLDHKREEETGKEEKEEARLVTEEGEEAAKLEILKKWLETLKKKIPPNNKPDV